MKALVVILIIVCCLMGAFQVICLTDALQEAKSAKQCAIKCNSMGGSVTIATVEDCICATPAGNMIWFKLR